MATFQRRGVLRASVCVARIFIAIVLLLLLLIFSELGGTLNRCRGGFLNLTSLPYWPAHELSRELFSLITGVVVFFAAGLNIRAALIVWLLTQWSLFVGWGSYMNIGTVPTNYNSRTGVFDWLLGRQEEHWNTSYTRRFIREYSGMSLRGLVWTAPQGYALQQLGFGWQYSLSGSLMSLVYFAGSKTQEQDGDFFDSTVAYSEFLWGAFLWFVLLISCLTQTVYRIRKWVYSHSTTSINNPYTRTDRLLYESLNHTVSAISYEMLIVLLWLVFGASVVYYSLISQSDLRNKGQTFFGLFVSLLCLTFFVGWRWSSAYVQHQIKLANKRSSQQVDLARRPPPRINDIDRLERGGRSYPRGETDPLLPWPYSHPDKGYVDRRKSPIAIDTPTTPTYGSYSPVMYPSLSRATPVGTPTRRRRKPLSRPAVAFILVWPSIEKWVWLDLFPLCRHAIGLLSLLATGVTLVLSGVALVYGLDSPRFDTRCNITCDL